MSENKNPFRGENPFGKDRDLIYRHIGFTKRVTWNYQYFVTGVLILLILLKLVSRLRRVKGHQKEGPHRLTILLQSQPSSSLLRSWFKTNGTLINVFLFYLINLFILFYNLPLNDPFNFALRAGLVSASNVPLSFLIPLKSGPLLHFLQHSYENIMVYHRWVGIFVVLTALIHGSLSIYLLTWKYCSTNQHMLTGYFCMSMFLLISMSSVKVTRAKFYELFYCIHFGSFLMFLLVFFFHHYVCKTFVIVVTCLLVYDRFARYLWYFWCLKCSAALVKDDKYMVVTIFSQLYNLPRMQRVISYCLLKLKKNFSWEPSNHLFITIPAVDVFQSHLFTISSLESEGKCQLLIQVHDGFTKRLYDRVRKGETEFTCIINGPYEVHISTYQTQITTLQSIRWSY
jgi:predicted ferric reductase